MGKKYTVQNDAGKKITFEWYGDAEPSDGDFEEVFASADTSTEQPRQRVAAGLDMVSPRSLPSMGAFSTMRGRQIASTRPKAGEFGVPSSYTTNEVDQRIPVYERTLTGEAVFPQDEVTTVGERLPATPESEALRRRVEFARSQERQRQILAAQPTSLKNVEQPYIPTQEEFLTDPIANPAGAMVAGIVGGVKRTGKALGEYVRHGYDTPEGARALVDVGLGAAGTAISAIPEVALSGALAGAITPLAGELGQKIGGDKGRKVAETISHYATAIPFGQRVILAMAASQLGSHGVEEALKGGWAKGISDEDKARIVEGSGHVGFFGALGVQSGTLRAYEKIRDKVNSGEKLTVAEENIRRTNPQVFAKLTEEQTSAGLREQSVTEKAFELPKESLPSEKATPTPKKEMGVVQPAPIPSSQGKGGAKQPWEMTIDELSQFRRENYNLSFSELSAKEQQAAIEDFRGQEGGDYAKAPNERIADELTYYSFDTETHTLGGEPVPHKYTLSSHRNAVEMAIERGESVSSEVLKDYPDLAKKYQSVKGKEPTSKAVIINEKGGKNPSAVNLDKGSQWVTVDGKNRYYLEKHSDGTRSIHFKNGVESGLAEKVGLFGKYPKTADEVRALAEQLYNAGVFRDSPKHESLLGQHPDIKSEWYWDRFNSDASRKYAVQKALSEGKTVPPEVLKDYPDLAKAQTKEKVEEPTITREQKRDLVEAGFTVKELKKMKPEEAKKILGEETKPKAEETAWSEGDKFSHSGKEYVVVKPYSDGSVTAVQLINGKRALTGESWRPESLKQVERVESASQEPRRPEMLTRDEFEKSVPIKPLGKSEASVPVENGMQFRFDVPKDVEDIVGYARKRVIQRALSEGKPVYSGWEKDYPDLAKKYQSPSVKGETPKSETPKESVTTVLERHRLEKEIAKVDKRMDGLRETYMRSLNNNTFTRSRTTSYNANMDRLAESKQALKTQLDKLSESLPPEKGKEEITPLKKQWDAVKEKHPDTVLLMRMGDFFEMFEGDAKIGKDVLGLTMTKDRGGRPIAGFPHHAMDEQLRKLVKAGHRVAIVEQEGSEAAKNIQKADVQVIEPRGKEETPAEPLTQSKMKEAVPKYRLTYEEFLKEPRTIEFVDDLRKLPRREFTPEELQAKKRLDDAFDGLSKNNLSWLTDRPEEGRNLKGAKKKVWDEYNNAWKEQFAVDKKYGDEKQRWIYDHAVEAGLIDNGKVKEGVPSSVPTERTTPKGVETVGLSEPEAKPIEQPKENEYPIAKDVVDGRIVRDETPNMSSIASSLTDYEVLEGVREVPMSDFELTGKTYDKVGNDRIRALQSEISESGEISPLIVVRDSKGSYILEGAHRADALKNLGAKSFPAVVVIDMSETTVRTNEKPVRAQLQSELEKTRGKEEAEANMRLVDATVKVLSDATGKSADEILNLSVKKSTPKEVGKDVLMQETAKPFFSQLTKSVEELKQEKWNGQQLLNKFTQTAGVKKEEMQWTGLDDFLKSKPSVTRQEVLDYLKENEVRVEEKVLGNQPTIQYKTLGGGRFLLTRINAEDVSEKGWEFDSHKEMKDWATEWRSAQSGSDFHEGQTKFSQHVEPGAKKGSYRELLLTLPIGGKLSDVEFRRLDELEAQQARAQATGSSKSPLTESEFTEYKRLRERYLPTQQAFKSSHFDEPNVLAHIRFNEREVDGKKVLFIEEIQSDWHQKGRKEGYNIPDNPAMVVQKLREKLPARAVFNADETTFHDPSTGDRKVPLSKYLSQDEITKLNDSLRAIEESPGGMTVESGVPDAPFKSTWHELAFRRAVRYAAENGYDAVSWTTGEQQVSRYSESLRKEYDKIEWKKTERGVDLTGYKDGKKRIDTTYREDELTNAIGKAMADQIRNSPNQNGAFEGNDITVSDTGMAGFYDKILVDYANKFGKKFGAKVGEAGIDVPPPRLRYEVQAARGTPYDAFPTRQGAEDAARTLGRGYKVVDTATKAPVHSMDITPEMRRTAMEQGFPLFQGKQGAIEFLNNNKALVHIFENANASTFPHEFSHWSRRMLYWARDNALPEKKAELEQMVRVAENWTGVKDGNWTKPAEEKFARGFERYLRDGQAPTPALKKVFEQFKAWLTDIYQSIKGSAIDVKIPDEMRKVYDQMLGGKAEGQDVLSRAEAAGLEITEAQRKAVAVGNKGVIEMMERRVAMKGRKGTSQGLGTLGSARGAERKSIIGTKQIPEDESGVSDFLVSQRVKSVLEKIGVPAAERYVPNRFLGIYKYRSKNVRVKSLFDVFVASHEGMHYISKEHGVGKQLMKVVGKTASGNPIYDSATSGVRKRLTDIFVEYYPGANRKQKLEKRVEEGIAVLLENYLYDPNGVNEKYPDLVNQFIKPTGRFYHPKVTELLDGMNSLVDDYAKMTPDQRIGARIVRGEEAVKKDTGFDVAQRATFELANTAEPLKRYSKYVGEYSEASPWAFYEGAILPKNTVIYQWLSGDHTQVLGKDGNWSREKGSVANIQKMIRGKEELFDRYLVARRIVADHNRLSELKEEIEAREAEAGDVIPKEEGEALDVLRRQADKLAGVIANDNFSLQDANATVKKFEKQFVEPSKMFDDINRRLVDFSENAGLISSERAEEYRSGEGYASFQRNIIDDLGLPSTSKTGGKTAQAKVRSFKERTGSERDIISPSYNQSQAVVEVVNKALDNVLWKKVVDIAEIEPEVARRFEKIETIRVPRDDGSIEYPQRNDPNLVQVLDGGTVRFYKPAPEFKEVMESMRGHGLDTFAQLVRMPSQFFTRLTTSANPLFALGNFPIDQISLAAQTKVGTKPILDPLKGLVEYIREFMGHADEKTQVFRKYLETGGKRQTFASQFGLSPEEALRKVAHEKTRFEKTAHIIDVGLSALELPSNLSEYLSRFAEYRNAKNRGMSDVVAMALANEVTTPFALRGHMGGKVGQVWRDSIPYLNAAIQVMYKTGRAVGENPERFATVAGAVIASSFAAAIGTMAAADDETKRLLSNMPARELARALFFPNPFGKGLVRIRIPEQIGSITGLVYAYVIQNYKGNKVHFDDFLDIATASVPAAFDVMKPKEWAISVLPQVLKPSIEVAANIKTYPNLAPIVGEGMKYDPVEQQYDAYTSKVAIELGKILGMSPKKVDFWIREQFGAVGGMLAKVSSGDDPVSGRLPIFRQEQQYIMSGRAYNSFYDKKEVVSEQFKRLSYPNSFADEEKARIVEAYNLSEDMNLVLSNMRKVYKEHRDLPERMRADAYQLLLSYQNDEEPKKLISMVRTLNSDVRLLARELKLKEKVSSLSDHSKRTAKFAKREKPPDVYLQSR